MNNKPGIAKFFLQVLIKIKGVLLVGRKVALKYLIVIPLKILIKENLMEELALLK